MRAIDADALKKLLQAWKCVAQERGAEINNMFASAIIAQVDAMPTIEPERKTGKWIDQDEGAFYPIECSECHKVPLLDAYGDCVCSDYCPDCGAKMEETE